jgi:glycosyltransferase involved in cell wall biosynthesis
MPVNEQISQKINELGICVIVPTYNNCNTLADVVNGVLQYTSNVIVVNDGSTDQTSSVLEQFKNIKIISYSQNQGKGIALREGFKSAIEQGYQYAITIDSDGQHNPDDIPLFVEKVDFEGEALIIGVRNMDQETVPGKSNFGRKFSNFWFKVETGITHDDTQSGFRLYPLKPIEKIKLFTSKFELEIELIVHLAWKGIEVKSVPVSVKYFPKEQRVSHFRPMVDFTRISILNSFLVILAFIYFRPVMFFSKKKLSELLFNKDETNHKKALSIAFGIFMGIIPIWGFQLALAILLAFLLKLNKPLVIIFANISIPPMIPFLIYLSMLCGKLWVTNPAIPDMHNLNFEVIKPYILQYIYGSITLAICAGVVIGLVSYFILHLFRKERIKTA